jgi:Zn-dependent protease
MEFDLVGGALWYGVFLCSTACHEAAHAWTALKLGDDTAQRNGQATLNPWPHMRHEPIGMIVLPLLTWAFAGWVIGWASAAFDPKWFRRFPRRAALMALAGPAANLAIVAVSVVVIRLGVEASVFHAPTDLALERVVTGGHDNGLEDLAARILSIVFSLNLLLFAFNLLPLPPLDGSNLPLLFLPEKTARRYLDLLRSKALTIAGFVLFPLGVALFYPTLFRFAASLLHPGMDYR